MRSPGGGAARDARPAPSGPQRQGAEVRWIRCAAAAGAAWAAAKSRPEVPASTGSIGRRHRPSGCRRGGGQSPARRDARRRVIVGGGRRFHGAGAAEAVGVPRRRVGARRDRGRRGTAVEPDRGRATSDTGGAARLSGPGVGGGWPGRRIREAGWTVDPLDVVADGQREPGVAEARARRRWGMSPGSVRAARSRRRGEGVRGRRSERRAPMWRGRR